MFKVAYASDNAFRIEYSILKAKEELSQTDTPQERQSELTKWIRALEKRLTNIKRTQRVNRRSRALLASNRSNGVD